MKQFAFSRFRTWVVLASVLLTVNVVGAIAVGITTVNRFQSIETTWATFTADAERKSVLLSEMRRHFGYGGFIHNFKNYVLRQDPKLLQLIDRDLYRLYGAIDEYGEIGTLTRHQLQALETVVSTIKKYEANLEVAKAAAAEGRFPHDTDHLVKVNDAPALLAMRYLADVLRDERRQAMKSVHGAVEDGLLVAGMGLVLLPLLAGTAIALVWVLRNMMRSMSRLLRDYDTELTERRRADAMVRKLTLAVEQAPAMIMITDPDGTIEYVNRRFVENTGYSEAEALGQTPRLLKSGRVPPMIYADLWNAVRAGRPWSGVLANRRKNGEIYHAAMTMAPLTDENGVVQNCVAIAEDVSERMRAEERLMHAQKMEAMGVMAGGIAHDFNNILTGIMGHCQILRDELDPTGDGTIDLDHIETATDRARKLVGQMLAFSRKREEIPNLVDVEDVVDEVLGLVRATTPARIEVIKQVDGPLCRVIANPTQVHQVILNLCTNSIDAMTEGPGRVTIRLSALRRDAPRPTEFPDLPAQDWARLDFIDTGEGIPSEVLDRIFDPFFTTKDVGKGTGLGLAVVHGIVRTHNGFIHVSSAAGEGTTFSIVLPSACAHQQGAGCPKPELGTCPLTEDQLRPTAAFAPRPLGL